MLTTLFKSSRHFMSLLDTVVHEVGHTVSALPIGSQLSIRLNPDGSGVSHGSSGIMGASFLAAPFRVVNAMAGYASPVLLGLFIVLTAYKETVTVSPWWLVVGVLWLVASLLLTVHLRTVGVLTLFASWIGIVLALSNTPSWWSEGVMSGADLTLLLLSYIAVVLTLSIRSFFTLLMTAVWGAVVWGLSLPITGGNSVVAVVLLTSVGVLFIISGFLSIISVARDLDGEESDFEILSSELAGTPLFWFVCFCILLTLVIGSLLLILL